MDIKSTTFLLLSSCLPLLFPSNRFPLHEAAEKGDIRRCELLLVRGFSIYYTDENGQTPLHLAARYSNKATCVFLVKKGAYVNIGTYPEIGCTGEVGITPLHYAARNNKKETCAFLIEKGAWVNKKTTLGFTPLHYAAEYGRESICALLLANHAHPNLKNLEGDTPLHLAAQYIDQDTCVRLIEKGAYVSIKNKNGETPLHMAARTGSKSICALLIEKGARINGKNENGDTPLHIATRNVNKSVCVLLIEKGAPINGKNGHGATPLDIAAKKGYKETCELLVLYGAHLNWNTLSLTVCDQTRTLIQGFLDGISNRETPLHWAAARGNLASFTFLMKQGANTQLLTRQGKTPFDLTQNSEIKNKLLIHEKIKVVGYLTNIKSREQVPQVIIGLTLSFFVGEINNTI